MRLKISAAATGLSVLLLAACSQSEVTRTDEAEESEPAEEEAEPLTPEQERVLSALEDAVRQNYGQRHFELVRFDLAPDGPDTYAGEVDLHDRLMDRRSTVDCRMTVSGGTITNGGCEDREPASARMRNTRIETLLDGSTSAEIRDELIREAGSTVGGQGRRNTLHSFDGEGNSFIVTFETASADGGETWQSGCAGEIRQADNGQHVAEYLCRERP